MKQLELLKQKLLEKGLEENLIEEILEPITKEFNKRLCGLVWETQPEDNANILKEALPSLEKKGEVYKNRDMINNILIEGDNLFSLTGLQYTHIDESQQGNIDIIYIDPPYNTGNEDFRYNDNFVNSDDQWRHSKWISFMDKRLRLAKNLLSDEGVIFISIDDNEQANLNLLCNSIFGEENFISSFPRITKKSGKTTTSFSKNNDYVLVYVKQSRDIFLMESHIDDNFKYSDEFEDVRGKYKLNQTLDYDSLQYGTTLDYPITIDGETFYAGNSYDKYLERQHGIHKRADWAWRWSEKLFEFGYKNGFVVVKENRNGGKRIYTKTYLNATIKKDSNGKYKIEIIDRKKAISSIEFIDNMYSNDNAKKELSLFSLNHPFDYPKPTSLIKRLIKSHFNKDAIVLDFFAGSGTTGQAVMELNKEDGGNRQFILCTNNEVSFDDEIKYLQTNGYIGRQPSKKEKSKYKEWLNNYNEFVKTEIYQSIINSDDYKKIGICQTITYPRLSKVINGYVSSARGNRKSKHIEGIPNNLYHYEVDMTCKESSIKEITIKRTINKFTSYVSIKENSFEMKENTDDYIIYGGNDKVVLVYRTPFKCEEEIAEEIESILKTYSESEKIAYSIIEKNKIINNVRYIPYPKEIIDKIKYAKMEANL